jgi:hypothetical protein
MRYILITVCFVLVGGCAQVDEFLFGTPGADDNLVAAYGAFYQMNGRPPFGYQQPQLYEYPSFLSTMPRSAIRPGYPPWLSIDIVELQRQRDIDNMLWERQHGAPYPFSRP